MIAENFICTAYLLPSPLSTNTTKHTIQMHRIVRATPNDQILSSKNAATHESTELVHINNTIKWLTFFIGHATKLYTKSHASCFLPVNTRELPYEVSFKSRDIIS